MCSTIFNGHCRCLFAKVIFRLTFVGRQGLCSNADCPYLHVNLDPAAPVCDAFMRGYCSAGTACRAKHLTKRMLRDMHAKRAPDAGKTVSKKRQARLCLISCSLALKTSCNNCRLGKITRCVWFRNALKYLIRTTDQQLDCCLPMKHSLSLNRLRTICPLRLRPAMSTSGRMLCRHGQNL